MASGIIPEFRPPASIETMAQAKQAVDSIRSTFAHDRLYMAEFSARVGPAINVLTDLIYGRCPDSGQVTQAVTRALSIGMNIMNMTPERVETVRRSHALRLQLHRWMTETNRDMVQATIGTAVLRAPVLEGGPRVLAVIARGKRGTSAAPAKKGAK